MQRRDGFRCGTLRASRVILMDRLVEPSPCYTQTSTGQSLGLSFVRQYTAGLRSRSPIASNRNSDTVRLAADCVNRGSRGLGGLDLEDISIGEPERSRSGSLDGVDLGIWIGWIGPGRQRDLGAWIGHRQHVTGRETRSTSFSQLQGKAAIGSPFLPAALSSQPLLPRPGDAAPACISPTFTCMRLPPKCLRCRVHQPSLVKSLNSVSQHARLCL
jgi:hypothetical protein